MEDPRELLPDRESAPVLVERLDARVLQVLALEAEHLGLLRDGVEPLAVITVDLAGHPELELGRGAARHVIDVTVGEEDASDPKRAGLAQGEHARQLSARIDDRRLAALAVGHEIAVLGEGPDDRVADDQHGPPPGASK